MQIWPNLADILSADISACISADKIGRYDYWSYSTVIAGWSKNTRFRKVSTVAIVAETA